MKYGLAQHLVKLFVIQMACSVMALKTLLLYVTAYPCSRKRRSFLNFMVFLFGALKMNLMEL